MRIKLGHSKGVQKQRCALFGPGQGQGTVLSPSLTVLSVALGYAHQQFFLVHERQNHWRGQENVTDTGPDANGTLKGDPLISLSLSSKYFTNEQVQHLI